ncbi:hypothetical protein C6A37_08550 [Desulfobacteraceae bacterium SEEP-SAG9]|nr:hypothetical protein C6A37_08550 [Desulfobacteraceae bacterium SEEP-SAG9]
MKTILASRDPVALDFYCAKYYIYPVSKKEYHDPDNRRSPVRKFLELTSKISNEGVLDEKMIKIKEFDFSKPPKV